MTRSLDTKLAAIRANPHATREFILADGKIGTEEAVRAYHGVLQSRNTKSHRSLAEDLQMTDQATGHDGSATKRTTVEVRNNPLAKTKTKTCGQKTVATDWPKHATGTPDFDHMTSEQRLAYDSAGLG